MQSKRDEKMSGQMQLAGVHQALEANAKRQKLPTGMPVLAVIREEVVRLGLPETDGDHLYDCWLASGFKTARGNKIKDWKASLRVWARNGWLPSQKKRASAVLDDTRATQRETTFKRMREGKNNGSY